MDAIIEKTVKKLEQDAILPYRSLQPVLVIIHKEDTQDSGAVSYLKSLTNKATQYNAIIRDIVSNTPIEVAQAIKEASYNPSVHGIIIISDYGNMNRTLYNLIPMRLDIDSLSAMSIGTLVDNISPIAYRNAPCTAVACMKIMETLNKSDDFSRKECLIIGRSIRVGRPLAEILTQKNMTVTLAHSKSPSFKTFNKSYDYTVSAIGKPKFWNADNTLYTVGYQDNCFIDVGMNFDENGKLCGDIDRDWFNEEISKSYRGTDSYINPITNGVGLVTTTVLFAKLFNNAADFFCNAAGQFQTSQEISKPQDIFDSISNKTTI